MEEGKEKDEKERIEEGKKRMKMKARDEKER